MTYALRLLIAALAAGLVASLLLSEYGCMSNIWAAWAGSVVGAGVMVGVVWVNYLVDKAEDGKTDARSS